MPTLIAAALFMFAIQAGLALEHITRVSTGLRFSSTHLLMSRRLSHLRREHIRLNTSSLRAQTAPYIRTSLGSRLLGVSPDAIYKNLELKGFKFEYSALKGPATTKLRRTLTHVTYPDGAEINIRSSEDALKFVDEVKGAFGDTELDRFKANRASFLLARLVGIPFLRFRVIINGLRDGSLKNSVRGSPVSFVRDQISESILDVKQGLANKLPRLKSTLGRLGLGEAAASVRADANKNLGKSTILANLRQSLDARQAVLRRAATASVAIAVITLACVVREIGTMIREAFKMRTRGTQDAAATLHTITSQARAGDMSGEVISDMTQRFEGFNTSANYQAGIQGRSGTDLIGVEGSDYSKEFSGTEIFDGWSVAPIVRFSDLLNPGSFLNAAVNYTKSNASVLGGLIGQVAGLLGDEIATAANLLARQFELACAAALNSAVQYGILALEIIATIAAVILSGGTAGAAKVGVGQVVKEITKVIGKTVIGSLAAGIALDILLFDYLLPGMVSNATGLETALTAGEAPENGARNYALIDYGMQNLATGENLASGGSLLSVDRAAAQTQAYLDYQRQEYADKGLANNIFSTDNPYSLASSLVVAQNSGGNWQQKGQSYIAGVFGSLSSNLDFFQTAYAQTNDNAAFKQIMYPDQDFVIGFNEAEMVGNDKLFAHEANTVYVEQNIEQLKEEYGICLGITADEFLLSQAGVTLNEYGHEYYPEKCEDIDARRYKIYYQDCVLIENTRLWGTNSSPMFSSQCDHLLPQTSQDILNEASFLSSTEGIGSDSFDFASPSSSEVVEYSPPAIATPVLPGSGIAAVQRKWSDDQAVVVMS